jgi:hypothetical protein
MSKTPSISTKNNVRSSFRDAIFTNLNIGLVEGYFCAFMLALGISEVIAGLGTVIPQFLGVVFQLLSIRSFFRKYSLKKRVLLFLTIQIFTMIPLILVGWFRISSASLIIGLLGLYWASLLSLNPPWNRLIGNTVPKKFHLKFFSIRSQFAQFAVFLGLIGSGILLYWSKQDSDEVGTFVGIFMAGMILKCLSWYEIKFYHQDFELPNGPEERLRFRDFIKRLRNTDQGKLVTFLFFFYITVHFSAPYFNPYMLQQLKLNYLEYMALTAIAYFGRVFMFRILQNRAKSKHVNKILLISVFGIGTSPLWWALSQNYIWLMMVEFLSGCYWAGFELSTILLFYQKIDDKERTSIITYISFLNVSGMIIGSLIGAAFMKSLPGHLITTSFFLRLQLSFALSF